MRNCTTNILYDDCSIEGALNRLNEISDNYPQRPLTLLIQNRDSQLVGTLTDGDIRRSLTSGKLITDPVSSFMKRDFSYLKKNGAHYEKTDHFNREGIKLLPVLDDKFQIVKIFDLTQVKSILPIEAVIMAGGEGKRLRPLTENIPKPLLKVGNKPIIEHNIDRLAKFGIEHITITINYLGDQIISYFGDGQEKELNIDYVKENVPLGTAGSLSLLSESEFEYLLVSNSDILTTLDYEAFFDDFIKKDADMSVVTVPYTVKVPYAVLNVENENISSLKEKPEYTYFSNAGIYLLKREILDLVPENEYLDITDLMEQLVAEGRKVVSFPFWGYWLDIGKHEDFEKAKKAIQILQDY